MGTRTIVVVGASLGGGRLVEALRRGGFDGRLVLVGDEPHRPYDRPPLSKKLLAGAMPVEKVFLRPDGFYEEKDVELRLGARAIGLSTTAREVELEGGDTIAFDELVIATGADLCRLSCPGHDLEGVHYVRTLDDSLALKERIARGGRAVIVGAGVIGAEVAATCRAAGLEVVLIEAAEVPLARAFGPVIGALYGELHRERGVDVRLSTHVTELRGQGRVEEVVTHTGERIPCDFVVAGIGVRPATGWLEGTDIARARGVRVDDRCRTNLPGIWAIGDVGEWWSEELGRHVTCESVDNAQIQAACVAKSLLGEDTRYAPVPFFWSDQYDLKLQSVGHVGAFDEVVYRGSLADRKVAAFHLREGRLAFTVAINRLKEIGASKKLIATRAPVDAAKLADESVSMSELLP